MKKLLFSLLFCFTSTLIFSQTEPVKLFVRGSGLLHYSPRILIVGSQIIYNADFSRGLRLTIISKSNQAVLHDQTYDCYGSTAASDGLAAKLNGITNEQIGVLTSYDAWEASVTPNLDAAFYRMGLTIAGATVNSGARRPYAAIFEAASNGESSAKSVEVSYNESPNQPYAEISGMLYQGTFVATGNQSNALMKPQGDGCGALVDSNGDLRVNGNIRIDKGGNNGLFIGTDIAWGGQTLPTIYNPNVAERWVMFQFPHVVWLQNGQRGYTGNSWGAITRYEGNLESSAYWDAGVVHTNPDAFTISRNNNPMLAINNTGDLNVNNRLFVSGIRMPGSYSIDSEIYQQNGNYISFGHAGVSEDFIGYRDHTFYMMDSPGGGDTNQPNLVVGGKITTTEIKVEQVVTASIDAEGTIHANAIKVAANGQTADFVFEDGYDLKELAEVEAYIKENKHLPNIPSATDMEANGVDVAEMNKLLLQKVEELTLYLLELKKENDKLKSELVELKNVVLIGK